VIQVAKLSPGYLLWVLQEVDNLDMDDEDEIVDALEEHSPWHHGKALQILERE